MPLTYIDIEKQKSWRIGIFFLFLLLLYFVIAMPAAMVFLHAPHRSGPGIWVFASVAAIVVAAVHFWFSAYNTVDSVVRGLDARPPDPQDEVHAMLLNILQEIHVVTGNKKRMRCVVVPSLALNALAAADLKGEAIIGITEGLLARLTRPQLEAVIAHEAHHILSGDCLETTVAASLFGTFSSAMERLNDTSRGRAVSVSFTYLLGWSLLQVSYLLNMFISREREYRADAASVRMTRNPIALAEALHLLARSWRGAGFIGSGYEMLCIVNPQIAALDESEGLWADLLSTHPPLGKRIDILLAMAHRSLSDLDARPDAAPAANGAQAAGPRYYAMDPQQKWQGPLALTQLTGLQWFSPLTWVTQGKDHPVVRAAKEPSLSAVFAAQLAEQNRPLSPYACLSCHQPLVQGSYEGTRIEQCRFCGGALVENDKIQRILARTGRDHTCTERINALARTVVRENQQKLILRRAERQDRSAIVHAPCPKCGNPMSRGFYSQAHLIEIDRCSLCGLTWFDQDELEMLQCLIENRLAPEGGPTVKGMNS